MNAEEENEELHQAIDEPFSVKVHNLCNEKIELEYRIMSLKDALFGDLGRSSQLLRRSTSESATSTPWICRGEFRCLSGAKCKRCTRTSSARDRSEG